VTTQSEFVGRIRAALQLSRGRAEAARLERPATQLETIELELTERWPDALARFCREFERVAGVFHRVADVGDVPRLVAGIARDRGMRRLVMWPPAGLGVDLGPALHARGLEVLSMPDGVVENAGERSALRARVAAAEIGLTGVDLAVAETGTLIVRSGRDRPRSTSLLPPCHVAVFDRSALVETLEQVGAFLEAWHREDPETSGAAISFITGPSRTADIELTLTRGVHGPGEIHAVFVERLIRG